MVVEIDLHQWEQKPKRKYNYTREEHPPMKDVQASEPIPFFWQLSDRLSLMEIAVLGVIYQNGGIGTVGCLITNAEIASYFNMTVQRVSNCICRMRNKWLLKVQIEWWKDTRQRRIFIMAKLDW